MLSYETSTVNGRNKLYFLAEKRSITCSGVHKSSQYIPNATVLKWNH